MNGVSISINQTFTMGGKHTFYSSQAKKPPKTFYQGKKSDSHTSFKEYKVLHSGARKLKKVQGKKTREIK